MALPARAGLEVRLSTVVTEWESLGGGLTSAPAICSWGPTHLEVFARGDDQALWHRRFLDGAWGEWESLGGVLTSPPAAVSWGAGRVDVFVRGTDDALWHRWFDGQLARVGVARRAAQLRAGRCLVGSAPPGRLRPRPGQRHLAADVRRRLERLGVDRAGLHHDRPAGHRRRSRRAPAGSICSPGSSCAGTSGTGRSPATSGVHRGR